MNTNVRRSTLIVAALVAIAALYGLAAPSSYSQEAPPAAGALRVAVVDIEKVYQNYKKAKAGRERLQALAQEAEKYSEKLTADVNKIKQIMDKLPKDSDAWWDRNTQMGKIVLEQENHRKQMQAKLLKAGAKSTRDAYDVIVAEVEGFGAGHQFDIILWKKAPMDKNAAFRQTIEEIRQRPILYASDRLDITEQITERLNKNFEKDD